MEPRLRDAGDSVAAVLIEPMLQGAGGMIVWPAEFVAGVRRLCDKYKTLMIADEVLTGFGRTGKMFACEHASITPDIICLSKALTAGYLPLGVTATTAEVYDAFLSDDRNKTFFHGHSYTANPLACAVAIASLDLFREEPVLADIARLEQQLRDGFEPLRALGDVRVIGGVARSGTDLGQAGVPRRDRSPAGCRVSRARVCCCDRSATSSTSCRPIASRNPRPHGRWNRSSSVLLLTASRLVVVRSTVCGFCTGEFSRESIRNK